MVIMRVWTLAHTSPLLSLCYFAPFCRKFCWVGVEFLSSGAQGLFSPKKKTKHPKLDHVFLATCSSSIFSSGFCFTKNCYQGLLTFSQTTIQVETIFILGNDYSKSCFRECQRVPGCLQLQPENMTICRDRLPSALLNVRMVNSNKEPESLRCWRGKNLEDGPNGAKKERDCLSMMKK